MFTSTAYIDVNCVFVWYKDARGDTYILTRNEIDKERRKRRTKTSASVCGAEYVPISVIFFYFLSSNIHLNLLFVVCYCGKQAMRWHKSQL